MSTVAEIESAIERLQPSEVTQLADWLYQHQLTIQASAEIFGMYDGEEVSCKKPSEAESVVIDLRMPPEGPSLADSPINYLAHEPS